MKDIIGEENDDDHCVGNRSGSLGETRSLVQKWEELAPASPSSMFNYRRCHRQRGFRRGGELWSTDDNDETVSCELNLVINIFLVILAASGWPRWPTNHPPEARVGISSTRERLHTKQLKPNYSTLPSTHAKQAHNLTQVYLHRYHRHTIHCTAMIMKGNTAAGTCSFDGDGEGWKVWWDLLGKEWVSVLIGHCLAVWWYWGLKREDC